MALKYKLKIKHTHQRAVLSDVLPYEIPLTFSNRYFYHFLIENGIKFENDKIIWQGNNPAIKAIISLLFGVDTNNNPNHAALKSSSVRSIPFSYKICHKEDDFRELTIPHPKNQLIVSSFYNQYRNLIIYYSNIGSFSIRRVVDVAKYIYHKDITHSKTVSKFQNQESVEQYNKEYTSFKTFFTYKDYSNIHKFYESYKYHKCERKYNSLYKFDISKCFDSIYTHSINWATTNKDSVKSNIIQSNDTFGGRFDTIIQSLNYGETNGIVIGPEFSRIFAEIILQRVDKNIENNLKVKYELKNKVDYEIFRYVDDYFVFFNKQVDKDHVVNEIKYCLKEYKLSLNESKSKEWKKPFITEQTIAKQLISELLNKHLAFNVQESVIADENNEEIISETGSIYVSSNKLITKFKIIIKESNVDYKDILNYALSLIERKVEMLINQYTHFTKHRNSEKNITKALLEILYFTFFIYSSFPRVNTTIRLCRILRHLIIFLRKRNSISLDYKHIIYKSIFDNIQFILQKNSTIKHTQVETLYLLIILKELGKEYHLEPKVLLKYFGIEELNEFNLNYFSTTVLIFYIGNKLKYTEIKNLIKNDIETAFSQHNNNTSLQKAELTFLLFDIMSCPYFDIDFKHKILKANGVSNKSLRLEIINKKKYWFTKWTNFDFGKELDSKSSQEVY